MTQSMIPPITVFVYKSNLHNTIDTKRIEGSDGINLHGVLNCFPPINMTACRKKENEKGREQSTIPLYLVTEMPFAKM